MSLADSTPVKCHGGEAGGVSDEVASKAGASPERLVRGHSGRLLLAISIGWLAVQAGRLVLSPLLPAIGRDLGVSTTALGVALTVVWGSYAVLQYPSGRLADRLSRKTPLVAGLLLLSVGFLVFAAAESYAVFLVGAVVVGVGAGLYPTAARALVADHFRARRGQAFGLHTGSGDLGGVSAAGLASVVLAVAAWRAAFLPVVLVLASVAVALHVWSREDYALGRPAMGLSDTATRLLGRPRLRRLLVVYTLYAFTWQAAVGFLPTYLRLGKGFDPVVANAAFAVLFGVGAVVKPLAGGVGDRLPRDLVAMGCLGLAALSLGGVVVAAAPPAAVAAVVAFAVGLMSFPPVMQAHLMDSFADESAGGDLGAMRSVYIGLGALGPTYVGAVADAVGFRAAFVGLVACLVAAAVLFLAAR